MDLDKRKIAAAQKLLATEHASVIEQVEHILSDNRSVMLTKNQKEMIDEALYSLENDGKMLHDDVVRETHQRYSNK